MTGILKNQLSDAALLRLENEVTNYCKAMGLEDDGNKQYPYAWLIAPLHDAAVLRDYSNNAWIGGIANLFRLGYRSDLEQRQQWHFHSVRAAAMLCIAYAENLQSGRVARDDMLTMAAVMKDLALRCRCSRRCRSGSAATLSLAPPSWVRMPSAWAVVRSPPMRMSPSLNGEAT